MIRLLLILMLVAGCSTTPSNPADDLRACINECFPDDDGCINGCRHGCYYDCIGDECIDRLTCERWCKADCGDDADCAAACWDRCPIPDPEICTEELYARCDEMCFLP